MSDSNPKFVFLEIDNSSRELARLREENERLREAAGVLVNVPTDRSFYGTEAEQEAALDALDRLRAALSQTGDSEEER